ncbi:UNVERIFIED_CONTAM: hypothetical protein DES50_11448 [Williamsia faeni]
MGEQFKASPTEISGLGNYVLAVNDGVTQAVNLVKQHTAATGEFKGLMDALREPIDTLHAATSTRLETLPPSLSGTSVSLKQTAWNYTTTERTSALGFEHTKQQIIDKAPFAPPFSPSSISGTPENNDRFIRWDVVDDVPGAVAFRTPTPVDVIPPPSENVDWNALIEDTAGWLADADSAIERLVRWSPLTAALNPLAGNWLELKRIGNTYGKAGTALGTSGDDLIWSSKEIDSYWDGAAAIAYTTYSTNMANGLEWNAAAGRLIDTGLQIAAQGLEDAARATIELIKEGLSRLIKVDSWQGVLKVAAKVIPYAGTAAAVGEVSALLTEVGKEIHQMIEAITSTIDALKAFIEFCEDPIGSTSGQMDAAAQRKIDEKLQPINALVNEYNAAEANAEQKAQDVEDLLTAADIQALLNQPKTPFSVGTDNQPWEDAQ